MSLVSLLVLSIHYGINTTRLGVVDQPDLEVKKATALYDTKIQLTKELMG
jgi:hypothetical protein